MTETNFKIIFSKAHCQMGEPIHYSVPHSANKRPYKGSLLRSEVFDEVGLPLFNPLLTPVYSLIHVAFPRVIEKMCVFDCGFRRPGIRH